MAAAKKTKESKIVSEDISVFKNQSQYLKDFLEAKGKRPRKRQGNEQFEEEDMSKLNGQYQASVKKKKIEADVDGAAESRHKILAFVGHQLEERKQSNKKLFKNLAEMITKVKADYNTMKENEQKLEHLTESYIKCARQATTAYKQKLEALEDTQAMFLKGFDEMDSEHQEETNKLADKLQYDIKKLQDELTSQGKRSSWESLRRSIFQAMQNDL